MSDVSDARGFLVLYLSASNSNPLASWNWYGDGSSEAPFGAPRFVCDTLDDLEAILEDLADFYDALVSKRYYKPAMPFDQATEIILDGMGTFFDKRMEKYFLAAREKLEEYYDKQPVE